MNVTKVKAGVNGIVSWCLAGFFTLAALVYLPAGGTSTLSGIFAALFAAIVVPIKPWQALLQRFLKGKLKTIVAVVLAILTFVVYPSEIPNSDPIASTGPAASIETTIETVPSAEETMPIVDAADPTGPETQPTTPATQPSEPTDATSEPTTAPTDLTPSEPETQPQEPTTAPTTQPTNPPSTEPSQSTFSVHFIDVGQADAALVECDGHYMLIDGGNKADSNTIYSVLKKAGVTKLDIVVGTHAHEDHIGGLPGAYNYCSADLTLCPVTSYDSNAFNDFVKYANLKGGGITVPKAGDTYALGSATVTILGVNGGSDTNDTSIILRIDYGETSFLFTGDAEYEAEKVVLNSGADLSATVLKVGHHGSNTSTNYTFLRAIMPQYAVISVGDENSYGHPTEDTLSRLRDAEVQLFRTDLQGDIYCISDGKTVTFSVSRNANADVFGCIGSNSTQTDPTVTQPTEPAPTDPPATQPEDSVALQVISWPETIGRNETGTVKIKGKANTEYTITVYYKSGPSTADGLEAKTSDANGYASWSWKVGGRTSPGTYKIVIAGGGETVTLQFTVAED